MTHETKKAAKADIFRGFREQAVSEFRKRLPAGMAVEDTWEGVMNAADYVLSHADSAGERGGAVMAAAMWTHGFLEEETYCRLSKLQEIVDSEVAAAAKATPTSAPSHSAQAAK